jgi:hypothetical protein
MKLSLLSTTCTLLSVVLAGVISPASVPAPLAEKRWTVSNPEQTTAGASYTITVISGIIVQNALADCM